MKQLQRDTKLLQGESKNHKEMQSNRDNQGTSFCLCEAFSM